MRLWIALLSAALCLGASFSACAQIRLEKTLVKLTGNAGDTVSGEIAVKNTSAVEATVTTTIQDFTYKAPFTGAKKILLETPHLRSCTAWIRVQPQAFTVPPQGSQRVTYAITLPPEAQGEYWGVLFFEESSVVPVKGAAGFSAGAGLMVRRGCSIFVTTPDRKQSARLEDVSVSGNTIQGSFLNIGNVMLTSTKKTPFSFYVMNAAGELVDRDSIGEKRYHLPPGEKIPFSADTSEKLPHGSYTLVLNFSLEGNDVLVKEIDFLKTKSATVKVMQVRD